LATWHFARQRASLRTKAHVFEAGPPERCGRIALLADRDAYRPQGARPRDHLVEQGVQVGSVARGGHERRSCPEAGRQSQGDLWTDRRHADGVERLAQILDRTQGAPGSVADEPGGLVVPVARDEMD